jgi:hypothetical protein
MAGDVRQAWPLGKPWNPILSAQINDDNPSIYFQNGIW